MKEQPLVTIITPSFNQGRFLEATLKSVLNQDYGRMEYLVVDGGSTDDSPEIIHKYAPRLAWWVSEKDSGQSDAVNKGLRRAQGEIVGWLNSDDLYLPGAVKEAVAAFEKNPNAGVVYGDAQAIDADGKLFNVMRARPFSLVDLLAFNIICQPAAFMRRSILEKAGGLNPTYHLLMDNLLWMNMRRLSPFVYAPRVWAAARYHDQAKNRTRGAEYGQEARRLIADLRTQPEFKEIIAANERRIMAGVNRFDAFYLTDAGQNVKALKAYWDAFWLHPPTALSDWRHILLVKLSLLRLQKARSFYDQWRLNRLKK